MMKFTFGWLKDHLRSEASLDEIAAKLPQIGLEVEALIKPPKLDQFELARIVQVAPHPNADRLRLCRVETSSGAYDGQIVCGAQNLRVGQISVLAHIGAVIPATGKKLRASEIRGEASEGMLCSAAELAISDEADGILDLAATTPLAMNVAQALGLDDAVFHVEVTPNRPDWAGVRGIARDLAAAGLGELIKEDEISLPESFASPIEIQHDQDEARRACPLFAGRYVKGLTNRPSPDWLQRRLAAIGLRPIDALVDITNYITYDRARPLHVYDADKLAQSPDKNIHLRMAGSGEKFTALDGKDYALDENMCVVADSQKAQAIGGVIGGEGAGVSAATKNVFIESALFDPILTSRTGRTLAIESDARYRFERGVDPTSVIAGCDLAAKMILDICGGEVSALCVAGEAEDAPRAIRFTLAQIEKLTSVQVSAEKMRAILEDLGFTLQQQGDGWEAAPPSWRRDIARTTNSAGIADLAEEILRIHGVDHLDETPLPVPIKTSNDQPSAPSLHRLHHRRARAALAANGLIEAITWSFLPENVAPLFMSEDQCKNLTLANPISPQLAVMRGHLLSGLLLAVAQNLAHGRRDISLFEFGQVFARAQPEAQSWHIAGVRAGRVEMTRRARDWRGNGAEADLYAAKADMLTALAACGVDAAKLALTRDVPAYFHPGCAARVSLGGGKCIGFFGEIHPAILAKLDIDKKVAGFEINMDQLPAKKSAKTQKKKMDSSPLQAVRRDFAFIVPQQVAAAELIHAARAMLADWRAEVQLFDLFEDEQALGAGNKSLAIEVSLHPKAVLRDEEIDAVAQKIIRHIEQKTGGKLRR